MTNRVTPMSESVTEMRFYVRAAAEPAAAGESVKSCINRAARALRISPRRATTFWYGRPCSVLAAEMDEARAWFLRHVETELDRVEARHTELRDRRAALKAQLNDMDALARGAASYLGVGNTSGGGVIVRRCG